METALIFIILIISLTLLFRFLNWYSYERRESDNVRFVTPEERARLEQEFQKTKN